MNSNSMENPKKEDVQEKSTDTKATLRELPDGTMAMLTPEEYAEEMEARREQ